MKVTAINGSPRKTGNTAALLRQALSGAQSEGADTSLTHLYDITYQGCASCFACKRKGNACNGLCAVRDGLRPVLEAALSSDVLLLGAPVYFSDVTGEMRSFLERLVFPNLSYNEGERSLFHGNMKIGLICTMNVPQEMVGRIGYDKTFEKYQGLLRILGESEVLLSCDTWQFSDYSLYEASRFDAAHKLRVREAQFPRDCADAYGLGKRLAGSAAVNKK